jgi:hypothetical protein
VSPHRPRRLPLLALETLNLVQEGRIASLGLLAAGWAAHRCAGLAGVCGTIVSSACGGSNGTTNPNWFCSGARAACVGCARSPPGTARMCPGCALRPCATNTSRAASLLWPAWAKLPTPHST